MKTKIATLIALGALVGVLPAKALASGSANSSVSLSNEALKAVAQK